MNMRIFSVFLLCICLGLYFLYTTFQMENPKIAELEFQIQSLEQDLLDLEIQKSLAQYELESFKQYVAVHLPENIEGQKYQVRNIASLVSSSQGEVVDLAKFKFEKIREAYLDKNYEWVNRELSDFLETHIDSVYILEGYFLLANSYYNSNLYEKSLETIHVLLTQFPESEMTGLGLLVMGDILESMERWEEAQDIYKSIEKNFKFQELKKEATRRLERIRF